VGLAVAVGYQGENVTLLAADALDPKKYFKADSAVIRQGSSFDLTIGHIYNSDGEPIIGPFKLKPNHMVQVVSAQVFNLPNDVTGHVTYKTSLTSEGIWALTVGIVDPGWDGPIATTLLNFSKIERSIAPGDPFLRVTLFEHAPVSSNQCREAKGGVGAYLRRVQEDASSIFPKTFLNQKVLARRAGERAASKMRKQAWGWAGVIAAIFALAQIVTSYVQPSLVIPLFSRPDTVSLREFLELKAELQSTKDHVKDLELSITALRKPPPAP
jgi:deoxycytidine triphosphate deaminase